MATVQLLTSEGNCSRLGAIVVSTTSQGTGTRLWKRTMSNIKGTLMQLMITWDPLGKWWACRYKSNADRTDRHTIVGLGFCAWQKSLEIRAWLSVVSFTLPNSRKHCLTANLKSSGEASETQDLEPFEVNSCVPTYVYTGVRYQSGRNVSHSNMMYSDHCIFKTYVNINFNKIYIENLVKIK